MTSPPTTNFLLFDTPPLLHAIKADRLDVLGDLVKDFTCLTTRAVVDEAGRRYAGARAEVTQAPWLSIVEGDSLDLMISFAKWSQLMGISEGWNTGEATLCAYADVHGGTLILDDKDARKVASGHGLVVRGTVGLIADACKRGDCTVTGASVLVDALHESGMRLPFTKGGFEAWARKKKLLG